MGKKNALGYFIPLIYDKHVYFIIKMAVFHLKYYTYVCMGLKMICYEFHKSLYLNKCTSI